MGKINWTIKQWEPLDADRLIRNWLSYAESRSRSKAHFWAFCCLEDYVHHEPETAWPIILQLVSKALDDHVLAFLAAGPLENLIHSHGPEFIDRAVLEAKNDKRFRKCLRGVWGIDRMPARVREKFENAVKGEPVW